MRATEVEEYEGVVPKCWVKRKSGKACSLDRRSGLSRRSNNNRDILDATVVCQRGTVGIDNAHVMGFINKNPSAAG
jgi:hypothetical protein